MHDLVRAHPEDVHLEEEEGVAPSHRATGPKHKANEAAPKAPKKRLGPQTFDVGAALQSGEILTHRGAMDLQRQAGNRATRSFIQAKLIVGPAGDRYEQDADRMASQVMRTLQRQPEEDEELQMKPLVQRRAAEPVVGMEGGPLDANTDAAIRQAKGKGKALDTNLRRSMEGGFGTDFSGVRVHDDASAHKINEKLQAKAFTSGSDIFFRKGDYNPSTSSGQELLAHELTHVVQQGAAAPSGGTTRRKASSEHAGSDRVTKSAIPTRPLPEQGVESARRKNGAQLVNFRTTSMKPDKDGYVTHQVAWDSSTGQLGDLDDFKTREHVLWNACPWAIKETDAAYRSAGDHHGIGQGKGEFGVGVDTHEAIKPYADAAGLTLKRGETSQPLTMSQEYEYSEAGGDWHPIPNSRYTLTRTLTRGRFWGNRYQGTMTKEGVDEDIKATASKWYTPE